MQVSKQLTPAPPAPPASPPTQPQITAVSPAIAECRVLKIVNLGHNELRSVPVRTSASSSVDTPTPSVIFKRAQPTSPFGSLARVRLRSPSQDELCFLPELRQLRLEQNALATLPTDIGRLSLLSELDVSNNRITRLPDSIGRLTQLRKLNCSANLLAELPATFERLQALEELEAWWPIYRRVTWVFGGGVRGR